MDAQQKEMVDALRRRIRELEQQKEVYDRAMRNLLETHQVYRTLIENQTLRTQLGSAGRERIKARYSLMTHAPRLTGLFNTVLAGTVDRPV